MAGDLGYNQKPSPGLSLCAFTVIPTHVFPLIQLILQFLVRAVVCVGTG